MKKFKKVIFLACFVMLIAVMAIAVSAYDTSTDRKVEVTLPSGVTTVNNEAVSGTTASLSLYDSDGNALTWYVDSTGTNLVSVSTKDIMSISGGYLRFTTDGRSIRAKIVVLNIQDDGLSTSHKWGNVDPSNADPTKDNGIQYSTFLQYIYFSDSTTGFYAAETFIGCTNLKGVYFTVNSKLTEIYPRTFKNCTGLTEAVLPPSLKTLRGYVFNGCSSLEKIILSNSVSTIREEAFNGISDSAKFFFIGTGTELATLINNTSNSKNTIFKNAKQISAEDYADLTEKTGAYAVYDYQDAYDNGGHTMSATSVLAYANGFDKSGTRTCTCEYCGYTEVVGTIDPIFTANGYSVNEDHTSIYGGFTVNIDALNAYNSYLGEGKGLRYGIIISNVTGLSGINFNDKGVIDNEKSIQVEIKDRTFSRFGFSINKFTDETKGLELVISAYVIDETGNVFFIQKDGAMDGTYYLSGISANGKENALGVMTLERVIALTPTQEPAAEVSETKEIA